MATKTRRLWTAFLGGSAVLGVGLINLQGLRKRKLLFDEGLCESGDNNKPELSAKDGDTDYLTNKQVRERSVLLEKARSLVQRVKEEKGCPGLSISVSVNGRTVWSEGFGYSDLENDVPCKPTTVMRIASISKPLTATAIMELLEKGKLNLDDPVQKYVTSFPVKQVNSKECTITIRHLLSHLSGIRHYYEKEESKNMNANESKDDAKKKTKSEFERPEYYIKECYDTVEKSLSLFKDDPLVHEPGTDYLYTTYGWTLLSAVVESAAEQDFLKYMDGLFERLDMTQTQTQLHGKLIYGRARFYVRDSKGRLKNTPYVDNCYKLAGGGLLSTSEDLIKFGNAMLYSSQVGKYRKISKKALLPGKKPLLSIA